MSAILVTPPATEPVTIDEAKAHLRVMGSDENTYIEELVKTAREHIEEYTQRRLITQTWDLFLDKFPEAGGTIEIPFGRAQSIGHIKYYDLNGIEQTWAADQYEAGLNRIIGIIQPVEGGSWPQIKNKLEAVNIRFTCGYGDAAAVPTPLKQAMKLLIGNYFENREEAVIGTISSELPLGVKALLAPYRIYNF